MTPKKNTAATKHFKAGRMGEAGRTSSPVASLLKWLNSTNGPIGKTAGMYIQPRKGRSLIVSCEEIN